MRHIAHLSSLISLDYLNVLLVLSSNTIEDIVIPQVTNSGHEILKSQVEMAINFHKVEWMLGRQLCYCESLKFEYICNKQINKHHDIYLYL